MTEEQIKQNAHNYTYVNDHNWTWTWDDSGESRVDISVEVTDAFIAGAHSRDKEIEQLESLLDKAVHMLKETYSGSDFFCERLHEIPEEDLHCMKYCDKDDIRCDCVLRYLKLKDAKKNK